MALFTWADTLLPAVDTNPHSRNLILQLVENILSQPNARTILVERAVFEDHGVIPPFSFESLLRLTFPDSSARVKATARFEAIYPLLKELALAGTPGGEAMKKAARQIFIFSLRLAGGANPVLAKEATSIAIWALTENIVCCNHWDNLYENNLKASVALLKNLVDEWKDHSRKLSSSRSNTLTLNQTMKSFRLKNEKAINEGGANASLYKEADESCKVILGRLSWKSTAITALVLAAVVVVLAAVVLSFKPRLQPC
ncbi:uncharacterized protein LOC9298984 isoform X2 [Arabidopsis lyrata subsp. lyrata]|nr:uncharacterized protein LOC9298984 isoform X2 [Arabidopsis lyrata subsp. lyrata]|eukprot:XP_020873669.1 uncharacterized protein LOC9298984 isoform X2 [Arabidopsis lyrata subsp. lyrata]